MLEELDGRVQPLRGPLRELLAKLQEVLEDPGAFGHSLRSEVLVDLGGLEGSLEGPMRLEGSLEGPILWRLHDAPGFPDVLEVAVGPDDGDGLVVEVLEDPGGFSLAHLVLKG